MDIHIKYMKRCIELASQVIGNTYPNPMVGCVIVHNNKIIGEGSTQEYGCNHAEVEAINSVVDKDLLKESILYVSLEPCNHYGKTPPCTKLILEKGIKNVVIGSKDPNRNVLGGGINTLISNGCNVEYGIMKEDCDALNKRFFTFQNQKRPYIILKWAESKDGYISPKKSVRNKGEIFWISNEQSKKMSHYFRSQEHSILVGVQTVIDDDPELTTRLVDGKNPIRIVLDPNNRIPNNSKVLSPESETSGLVQRTGPGDGTFAGRQGGCGFHWRSGNRSIRKHQQFLYRLPFPTQSETSGFWRGCRYCCPFRKADRHHEP